MLQFASSAVHVTGKKLVSAETFTWLGEHFQVTPVKLKEAADFVWLGGVNHIFSTALSWCLISPAGCESGCGIEVIGGGSWGREKGDAQPGEEAGRAGGGDHRVNGVGPHSVDHLGRRVRASHGRDP